MLNLECLGENPYVIHPFLLVHLPLSHPTTTLKVLLISWGSYCWGVECGRTVSPCPHTHSTSYLTLMLVGKPPPLSLHADSPLSPLRHSLHCLLILTHRWRIAGCFSHVAWERAVLMSSMIIAVGVYDFLTDLWMI